MPVATHIVGDERYISAKTSFNDENLSECVGRKVKIEHSLVPNGHFCTGNFAGFSPAMTLALNQDGRIGTSEVKAVYFPPRPDAKLHRKLGYEREAHISKGLANHLSKITADMGIAD